MSRLSDKSSEFVAAAIEQYNLDIDTKGILPINEKDRDRVIKILEVVIESCEGSHQACILHLALAKAIENHALRVLELMEQNRDQETEELEALTPEQFLVHMRDKSGTFNKELDE